jgi:SAM-dependent methyltransferase
MADARQIARRVVNRTCMIATTPPRLAAAALVRRRPRLAGHVSEWSWLWQPNWGKRTHHALYSGAVDPYQTASHTYEQTKYADILDVLGGRRYRRALEIGCSEGVFSAMLAPLCDELYAVDISEIAVGRARARLAGRDGVRVERRTLPLDFPDGPFDLIVCSDVLYLWPPEVLDIGLRSILSALGPDGLLLLQHFAGTFGAPVSGREVHRRARALHGDGGTLRLLRSERRDDVDPGGPREAGYMIELLQRTG